VRQLAIPTGDQPRAAVARLRRRQWTFSLDGRMYPYFVHKEGRTWHSERSVELALALPLLRRCAGARVLEVGNVTPCYSRPGPGHLVVDRYERAPGVRNEDIVRFVPESPFSLVISLSTIEHIGFDEDVDEPEKPLAAAQVLRDCVAPGGELLVTFPLGYNQRFDAQVRSGALASLDEISFLRRATADNRWEQVTLESLRHVRYGLPYPYANAIGVWRWRRTTQ
jgi:hypothetical protein